MIVAAGAREIRSAQALTEILAARKPGDELQLELIDTAGPRRVTIELTRRR